MAKICVFSGAKSGKNGYSGVARELGRLMGERGHDLVYGGANLGLMGRVVTSYNKIRPEKSIGIVPKKYAHFPQTEHTRVNTNTLWQRKEMMERKSDAFIALPGGFGTLDEICDVLSCKEGKDHKKPIVLLNHEGFFYHLLEFMGKIHREGFGKDVIMRESIYVAADPTEALDYIERNVD